jgi:hypothetical protein
MHKKRKKEGKKRKKRGENNEKSLRKDSRTAEILFFMVYLFCERQGVSPVKTRPSVYGRILAGSLKSRTES